ncbi:MAG TPA: hypothetical protein VH877_14685 [Polyangia bacterium]|nr:hypothetical protein [Polyangia bacterium]
MRHRGFLMGLGVFAALGLGGVAAADSNADVMVCPRPDLSTPKCPEARACFDVRATKNITHIFVDLDFDMCRSAPFVISVDGVDVPADRLHTRGGPCNHGDDDISRTVWFPLTGNQDKAQICVRVEGAVPQAISVGAKAADECVSASLSTPYCSNCGSECPPPPPPPYPYLNYTPAK